MPHNQIINDLTRQLIAIISETNGINLNDTLELMGHSALIKNNPLEEKQINEFKRLVAGFHQDEVDISTLLGHPVSKAFFNFFKNFPVKFYEEHIHLTGSLTADFVFPRLKKLLKGPNKKIYEKKITEVYGKDALPIESIEDVDNLIRLQDGEQFMTYLKILYLPKLVLIDKKAHFEAAYHMASDLYHNYNVGHIRLKFTLSRATTKKSEQIPGLDNISEDDVVLGLYEGYKQFQKENPGFNFILSPCFRKESEFFDAQNYDTKEDHFGAQVDKILELLEKYPQLAPHLCEVDTVGDEKNLYRKKHFFEMKMGLRKLQYKGFHIRSHHGETWKTLRTGIQSVDNSMNIWHIDTLEHGLSLGVNPNYYFHRLYQRVMDKNQSGEAITKNCPEYNEIVDMHWRELHIKDKILKGKPLDEEEQTMFIKTKYHTAREVEHYQHDVLNRMINKNVSLVALPTSNMKLTGSFPDYKDHPFSWWEKKGVKLGVGTDNYITLNTNYIQELLILLYSDPDNLKITKLLMVASRENRRPYIGNLLWSMRKIEQY
jgi:adenosine deaminase